MRLTKDMMRAEGQKVYDKFGMKAKLDFLAGAEWAMEHYEEAPQNMAKPDAYSLLGEVPNITDDNIQELREIILDSNSSKTYQNMKIREWFVRHFS